MGEQLCRQYAGQVAASSAALLAHSFWDRHCQCSGPADPVATSQPLRRSARVSHVYHRPCPRRGTLGRCRRRTTCNGGRSAGVRQHGRLSMLPGSHASRREIAVSEAEPDTPAHPGSHWQGSVRRLMTQRR